MTVSIKFEEISQLCHKLNKPYKWKVYKSGEKPNFGLYVYSNVKDDVKKLATYVNHDIHKKFSTYKEMVDFIHTLDLDQVASFNFYVHPELVDYYGCSSNCSSSGYYNKFNKHYEKLQSIWGYSIGQKTYHTPDRLEFFIMFIKFVIISTG